MTKGGENVMQELSSKVSLVLALVLQSALIKRGVKDPVPAFVLAGHGYMYLFFSHNFRAESSKQTRESAEHD